MVFGKLGMRKMRNKWKWEEVQRNWRGRKMIDPDRKIAFRERKVK